MKQSAITAGCLRLVLGVVCLALALPCASQQTTAVDLKTNPSSRGDTNSGSNASAYASAVPERCAIYHVLEQVMWVDTKGLIDSGSVLADLRSKRGDIVYVPFAAERYVSVLGEVNHPGALQLDRNTTLQKLLAEAGGLNVLPGQNPTIQIVSSATGKSRAIPFNSLLQPNAPDLTSRSGDIEFVTESGFNKFAYVLEKVSPLINNFTTAALFNRQQTTVASYCNEPRRA